ncbi:MAG: YraN family protein [Kofleriaceae bacterium]
MQTTMPDGRPTTIATGSRNEALATRYLVRRGYAIIDRNFKTKIGELDIVARDRRTLVFVEVRSRASADYGSALEAVTWEKQRRVSRMAKMYLSARRPRFDECRFDVVAITGERIELIRDAWRLGDRI